jgi:hypothetical protein
VLFRSDAFYDEIITGNDLGGLSQDRTQQEQEDNGAKHKL